MPPHTAPEPLDDNVSDDGFVNSFLVFFSPCKNVYVMSQFLSFGGAGKGTLDVPGSELASEEGVGESGVFEGIAAPESS